MTPGKWRKSSRSQGQGGNCVEARAWTSNGRFEIQDSKLTRSPILGMLTTDFAGFVEGLKSGRFDA